MVHPLRIRTSSLAGTRRGGFLPMLAASALSSVIPSIFERIFPRRAEGKRKRRAGLAAPYGGMKKKGGKRGRRSKGGAAFTPGPLA